jgi:hypothetical protein
MQYELRQQGDMFFHVETGQCVGYAVPLSNGKGFSVHRAMKIDGNERDKIGVVKSMDEALPKLTDYYEKNWPQWKRLRDSRFDYNRNEYTMFTKFIKWTFYGVFTVKQEETGRWVATRCTDPLLHDGEEAIFSTAGIARQVADLHDRDGFANYPALNDGYSWDGRPWILPGACQTNAQKVSFF